MKTAGGRGGAIPRRRAAAEGVTAFDSNGDLESRAVTGLLRLLFAITALCVLATSILCAASASAVIPTRLPPPRENPVESASVHGDAPVESAVAAGYGAGLSPTFPLYLGPGFSIVAGAASDPGVSAAFALHLGVVFDEDPAIATGAAASAAFPLYLAPQREGAAQSAPFVIDTWTTLPFELVSPRDGLVVATDGIEFAWSNLNADYYEIWVDDDPDFSSPELQPRFLAPNHLDCLSETAFDLSGNYLPAGRSYRWKVRAHAGDAWLDSPVQSFFYQPPVAAAPAWAPLYRLYKPADTDHFYTTSEGQLAIAEGSLFRRERVEGFISTRRFSSAGLAEVFRFYDASQRCHVYTAEAADPPASGVVDSLIAAGLLYEGIAGYAWRQEHAGLVPLYHVGRSDGSDHLYTTSAVEVARIPEAWPGQFDPATVALWVSSNGDTPWNLNGAWSATAGDGIDPGSGNFQHYAKTSFSLPGVGPPLEFEHIYNSRAVHVASQAMSLGPGWNHTYGASVTAAAGLYLVAWPEGNVHRYDQVTGRCLDDSLGVYDRLTDFGGGWLEILQKDQVVYTFRRPAGTPPQYPSLLVSIRDRNQNTVRLDYEPDGLRRLVTVTDCVGRQLHFGYRGEPGFESLLNEVRDIAGGRSISFAYDDTMCNLVAFTDCGGHTTRYYYDNGDTLQGQNHALTRIRLPRGNTIDNTYANRRLVAQRSSDGGGSVSVRYGIREAVIQTSAGEQAVEKRYGFTATGLVAKIETSGMPGAITFQRTDPANPGLPTWAQDERGLVTAYSYDARGNVLAIHHPSGTQRFEYDQMNNVTRSVDENGRATLLAYDGSGNLISATDPLGRTTALTRGSTGLLEGVQDPLGNRTRFAYDQYGNLNRIVDALGHETSLLNDAAGRLLSRTDAAGRVTSYTCTCDDQVATIVNAENGTTRSEYDGNANLVRVSDPLGHATQWSYDADLDVVASVVNAVGDVTRYAYNADGSMACRMSPTGTAEFHYDAAQRLVQLGASSATLQRDAGGNIVGVQDPHGVMSMTYDAMGRLSSQTDYHGNTVGYGYDAAGNLVRLTYPGDKSVYYTYDAANELTSVTDWGGNTTTYDYWGNGALANVHYGNGTTAHFEWDGAGRLLSLVHTRAGGGVIASYGLTRGPAGDVLGEERNGSVPLATAAWRDDAITVDAANRLQTAGAATFGYDGSGNLIWRQGPAPLACSYDLDNRLLSASGALAAEFVYDPFGNRWAATRDGVPVRYVLDLHGRMSRVLMELDATGAPTAYYVYGLGLVARIGADLNPDRGYYHFDPVGNIVAMSAADGVTLQSAYAYSPFGELVAAEAVGVDRNPFRFGGWAGVMAEGAGLYYMRARYYDASTGRFLSEDPVWTPNLYAYADNSPLLYVDPDGLRKKRVTRDYWRIAGDSLRSTWTMMKYVGTLGHAGANEVPLEGKIGYAAAMDIGDLHPGLRVFKSGVESGIVAARGALNQLTAEEGAGYLYGKAIPYFPAKNVLKVLTIDKWAHPPVAR